MKKDLKNTDVTKQDLENMLKECVLNNKEPIKKIIYDSDNEEYIKNTTTITTKKSKFKIVENDGNFKNKDSVLFLYHNQQQTLNYIQNQDYFKNSIIIQAKDIPTFQMHTLMELKKVINFNKKNIVFMVKIGGGDEITSDDKIYNLNDEEFFSKICRLIVREVK